MQEAYSLATESARKRAGRGKKHYDKRVRSSALKAGDRVLARNLTPRGRLGKLRSFWEKDVHIVVKRHGDSSPVYDVKPEIGTGAICTLHRNHLLVCDFLQPDTWEDLPQITRNRPYAQHTRNTAASSNDDDDDDVESDDDLPHSVPDGGVRQNIGEPNMVFDHGCWSLLCQCVPAPSLKFLLTLDSCILEKVLRYLPLASYLQYLCGWYHKLFLFSQIIVLKLKICCIFDLTC